MRKLQADDLYRIEQLGKYLGAPFTFSPDGGTLAYVLQRAKETAALHKWPRLAGNDRADVWLVDLPGGKPWNITDGLTDGAGYWVPAWSPDGERLAMLSTRGGNATLWVWEKATGQLRHLTQQGVRLDFSIRPYAWVSPHAILCPVLPEGERPDLMTLETRAAEAAMREWPKAWAGREATTSVLHSGGPGPLPGRPQAELLLINVADGGSRVVGTGVTQWSVTQVLAVSPDGSLAAFLRDAGPYRPEPGARLTFGGQYRFTLRVTPTRGGALSASDIGHDVVAGSLRWSPHGSELAFVSHGESRAMPPRVRVYGPADGSMRTFGVSGLDLAPPEEDPKLLWSPSGELLAYAAPWSAGGGAASGARRDWWLLDRDGGERALTGGMEEAPAELVPERGGTLVGVSGGDLWRIRPDGGLPEKLTEGFDRELTGITWPAGPEDIRADAASARGYHRLILEARDGELTDYYVADLPVVRPQELPKPLPKASVAAYSPASETVLYAAEDRSGTYLWSAAPPYRDFNLLLETNTFLREVTAAESERLEYRGLDGEELGGWILLPPGYRPGERRPLVVEVYPGAVQGSLPGWLTGINNSHALNLQILAAEGYAVLQPSMPLGPHGEASDPMLDLPKGVLPAVERAVELGYADPGRVFLLGHSYGGYGVYGLLTLTRRFNAAIALAGFSDLAGLYGTLDARDRYEEGAPPDLFWPALLEEGQGRMGGPPWGDGARCVRNSPVYHLDRVETPLLIIQGDMDYVALQQGEEFFTGLYRQGKRAQFVRYWGEGHVLESPANIRDMWRRILDWLEEFGGTRDS